MSIKMSIILSGALCSICSGLFAQEGGAKDYDLQDLFGRAEEKTSPVYRIHGE